MIRWRWGGGNAEGKVAEVVEEGKAEVTSNKVRISLAPLIRLYVLTSYICTT